MTPRQIIHDAGCAALSGLSDQQLMSLTGFATDPQKRNFYRLKDHIMDNHEKRGKRPYTAEECRTIADNYSSQSISQIAAMLGRSYHSVAIKAQSLGLSKSTNDRAATWRRNTESWRGTPFSIPATHEGRGRDCDAVPYPGGIK
jgi:hypothetical protein